MELAAHQGSLSRFLRAAASAGQRGILTGTQPVTLFAPIDAAFSRLPARALEVVLSDPDTLLEILTYHVTPEIVYASDLIHESSLETLHGGLLKIEAVDRIRINDAQVIQSNLVAENGVIHLIDRLLLPNSRRVFQAHTPLFAADSSRGSLLL